MENIKELRKSLVDVFNGVKSGKIGPKEAAGMNNTSGKIMTTVKVQLEYHKQRKDKPQIDFLKCH